MVISNEHLSKVFKLTSLPSLVLLPDAPRFTIAEVNFAYLEITGIKESDLIGKGIFEVFPDDSDGIVENLGHSLDHVIHTGKSHKMPVQKYHLPVPGTDVYVARYWKAENIPVLDECQTVYIIHTVQDITAEVRTQMELKENAYIVKEKFESLVNTIDGILWEADAQTIAFTYISPQVEHILGYSPKTWMGEPDFWQKHVVDEDRDEVINFCQSRTLAGEDHRFEYRMTKADGGIIWLEDIVSVITVDAKPVLLRGLMVDITQKKLAEEILKASEKKYELLFQTSPLPKWIYDIESNQILDVNETAVLLYGYSREEFLKMSINDISCSEDEPGLFETVHFAEEHVRMFSKGVQRHKKKNGDIIQVEIQKNIIDFNGSKAALILSNDITDRVHSIIALEEQNQKLKDIAFMQSHIVRAPLARMMEIITLFEDVEKHSPEFEELRKYFIASGKELDKVLKDIVVKTEPTDLTTMGGI